MPVIGLNMDGDCKLRAAKLVETACRSLVSDIDVIDIQHAEQRRGDVVSDSV